MTQPRPSLSEEIYLSFWSWSMLKACPQHFKLRILDKKRMEGPDDKGQAIQGGVPHLLSEDFFKKPIGDRDLNWFYENFQSYWDRWCEEITSKGDRIDWAHAGKMMLDKADRERLPLGYKDWVDYGKKVKFAETWKHVENLVHLIQANALHEMEVETELPFRVEVDPGVPPKDGQPGLPPIKLGGRIDAVFKTSDGFIDIWDLKGVKSDSKVDKDQVLIYKMGMEALGRKVRKTGFLMMKQNKMLPVKLLPAASAALKAQIRMAVRTAMSGNWQPNYNPYTCGYCDVKDHCQAYKALNRGDGLVQLPKNTPGKVEF